MSFKKLENAYLTLQNELNPVAAAHAGMEQYSKYYGKYDEADISHFLQELKAVSKQLKTVKVDTRAEQVDKYALFNSSVMLYYTLAKDQPQKNSPLFWVEHLYEGIYQIEKLTFSPQEKINSYIERTKAIPSFLASAQKTLTEPKGIFIESAIEINKTGVQLLAEVGKRLGADKHSQYKTIIQNAVRAIAEFNKYLLSHKESNTNFAVGREAFQFYIEHGYMLPYTIDQIWNYGNQLKEQTEARLNDMAHKIWNKKHWHEVLDVLRTSHPKINELIPAYSKEVETVKKFLHKTKIVPIPSIPLEVVRTPSFLAPTTPFAAYQPPAIHNNNVKGHLFVTIPKDEKSLKDHCNPEIPITVVHETYPGHHLQGSYATMLESRTRQLISTPLTVEGWALYCEHMMGEQGYYRNDEQKFFVYVHLLWRAIRVILDVGLQTKGISFESAVKYLAGNMNLEENTAREEVLRYCGTPTQPLSYALGRHELLRLRNDFGTDLYAFHKAVLSYGGLPITLMRYGMNI